MIAAAINVNPNGSSMGQIRERGIFTGTGSGANGVSGRTSAWLPLCYRRHRFPPEIIQHAIWLYLRFTLSYRDVEELLAERGLDISLRNRTALGSEVRSRDRTTAASASPSAERSLAC